MADYDAVDAFIPPSEVVASEPSEALDGSESFVPPELLGVFFMRAQDQGRAAGSNYSVWKSIGAPDYAGLGYATATPVPTGAMVAGSVVVMGRNA